MNIKITLLTLVLSTFAFARGDRGHSMAPEVKQGQERIKQNQQDRVPNKEDDSEFHQEVHKMENEEFDVDVTVDN